MPGIPFVFERAVWSAGFLVSLDCATVYQAVFGNRQYEGELRQGGTVLVPLVGNVTITEYRGAWPSSEWETLKASYAKLQIDRERKFLVKVPDVRQQFTQYNLVSIGTQRAAASMGQVIDRDVATVATRDVAGGGPQHRFGPFTVDDDMEPSTFIMGLRELLVDACAPMTSLRAIVPTWFASRLLLELGYRATEAGEATFLSGVGPGAPTVEFPRPAPGSYVATTYGVQIYQSAVVPTDNDGNSLIVLGDPMISFAGAIENVETLRIENDFAWGVKGLWVYGAGLLQPETMAIGLARRGTSPFMASARGGGARQLPAGGRQMPAAGAPAQAARERTA